MGQTFTKVGFVATLCGFVFCGSAVAAPLIVDTFETPAAPTIVTTGAPNFGSFGPTSGPGILGDRIVGYDKAGAGLLDLGDVVAVGGGTLFLASGPNVDGITVTTDYSNFGVLDLNGFNSLDLIFVPLFDNGVGVFDVVVTLTTGSGLLSSTTVVPNSFAPGGGTLQIPLAGLTGPGSLSTVTGIFIALNNSGTPSAAADFQLTQIQLTPVPEPASIAVWTILGAVGFGWCRGRGRRRSS